jgi:hypothetical protein
MPDLVRWCTKKGVVLWYNVTFLPGIISQIAKKLI